MIVKVVLFWIVCYCLPQRVPSIAVNSLFWNWLYSRRRPWSFVSKWYYINLKQVFFLQGNINVILKVLGYIERFSRSLKEHIYCLLSQQHWESTHILCAITNMQNIVLLWFRVMNCSLVFKTDFFQIQYNVIQKDFSTISKSERLFSWK